MLPRSILRVPWQGACGAGRESLGGHVPLGCLAGLSPPQCHLSGLLEPLEDGTGQHTYSEGFLQHPKKASRLRRLLWFRLRFRLPLLSVILSAWLFWSSPPSSIGGLWGVPGG